MAGLLLRVPRIEGGRTRRLTCCRIRHWRCRYTFINTLLLQRSRGIDGRQPAWTWLQIDSLLSKSQGGIGFTRVALVHAAIHVVVVSVNLMRWAEVPLSRHGRSVVVVVGHSPFVCLMFEPRRSHQNTFRNSQTGRKAAYPPQPNFEISKSSSFNSICDLWRIPSKLPTAGARYLWHWKSVPPACTASSLVFWGSLP